MPSSKEITSPYQVHSPHPSREVAHIIDLIRVLGPTTRAHLTEYTAKGRNAVAALVNEAMSTGLIIENGHAPSTGGRAPQTWAFSPSAGRVLAATIEVESYRVAITDLAGTVYAQKRKPWRIQSGPEETLRAIASDLRELSGQGNGPLSSDEGGAAPIWGMGLSVPGPVDHRTGRPSSPPIMPGWDGFDIPGFLSDLIHAPVLVDNDVNAMALGHPAESPEESFIFIQIGTGIGAGIISSGTLHRGARGAAGDIGHTRIPGAENTVCRCGRIGCLEASAGGWAQELSAHHLATSGMSSYLAQVLNQQGCISVADIVIGAQSGDSACAHLVAEAARDIGGVLAVLVSFYNPARIILAGTLPSGSSLFLEGVERAISEQALALATEDLRIETLTSGSDNSLRGCARMVVEAAFQI